MRKLSVLGLAVRPAATIGPPSRTATAVGESLPGRQTGTAPPLAVLAEIETSLTRIVGPIARIMVKRQLRNFTTLPLFCQALAAEIPSERERAAFLASLKAS